MSSLQTRENEATTPVNPVVIPPANQPGSLSFANREIRLTPGTLAWLFAGALGFVLALAALRELVSIILIVFLAITFALGIMPAVNKLESFKLPRVLAALLVYILIFAAFGLLIFYTLRPVTSQLSTLAQNAPQLATSIYNRLPVELQDPLKPVLNFAGADVGSSAPVTGTNPLTSPAATPVAVPPGTTISTTTTVTQTQGTASGAGNSSIVNSLSSLNFGAILSGLVSVLGGLGTVAIGFASILVIAFYWVMQRDQPQQLFLTILPPSRRAYANTIFEELATKIGGYIRGELILGLVIGGLSFVGLLFLGLSQYALVLATVAGLTELIPTIGPILGAIPAIFVAFATGGADLGIKVVILYIVIQQLENNLIVPRVMGSAVDLPPLLVLTAVLIWGSLFGLLGAFLAVPITAVIVVIFNRIVLPYLQTRAEAAG